MSVGSFTPSTAPVGTVGKAYSLNIQSVSSLTSSDTPTYLFEIISGSLPLGLTTSSAMGDSFMISGTPTESGSSEITILVTRISSGDQSTLKYNIVILPTGNLEIQTNFLPSGQVNLNYSASLTAFGGTSPYTWGIKTGTLPAGLTLDSSSGKISGTPTTAQTYDFTAQVTDSSTPPRTDLQPLSLIIVPSATPTSTNIFNEWWFYAILIGIFIIIWVAIGAGIFYDRRKKMRS